MSLKSLYREHRVPGWHSRPFPHYARAGNEGTLISLDNILETDNFESYDSSIIYPESGSFARFMIDNYGLDKMKSFFRVGNWKDSNAVIKRNFQSVYGFSINRAEEEWLKFLDNY